jgi:hypothetical protein
MPAHHRVYADPRILQRAAGIGPNTVAGIEARFAVYASTTAHRIAASGSRCAGMLASHAPEYWLLLGRNIQAGCVAWPAL